ncbi:MAG: MarR family transcriptional regulator [Alkalicoccus sp.]|nr:MAG: MarR family transcriptional regulator [Alkalicoccus sp.]
MMEEKRLLELIEQYSNVYLFATKRLDRVLVNRAMNISLEQFSILRALDSSGSLTAKQLAETMDVHKSAVTTKIARLEERKLVTREADDMDRRSFNITLTEEGRKVLEQSRQAVTDFIRPYFEQLDENELESFLNVYEKLNSMLLGEKD